VEALRTVQPASLPLERDVQAISSCLASFSLADWNRYPLQPRRNYLGRATAKRPWGLVSPIRAVCERRRLPSSVGQVMPPGASPNHGPRTLALRASFDGSSGSSGRHGGGSTDSCRGPAPPARCRTLSSLAASLAETNITSLGQRRTPHGFTGDPFSSISDGFCFATQRCWRCMFPFAEDVTASTGRREI
jgi:hypothetical protein